MTSATLKPYAHRTSTAYRRGRPAIVPIRAIMSGSRVPLPRTPDQQVLQATQAVLSAWRAGIKRQRVELALPLIGATDIDDWPGGIRQQFKAARPLVESLLRGLKDSEGLEGPLTGEIWDQGDAVAAWTGARLAAVIFPTAVALDRVVQLAERSPEPPELLLVINPQWESKGNLMSDFGFGARKEAAESFIASFTDTYYLRTQRIYGDELRVLRAHPGPWQALLAGRGGSVEPLASLAGRPSYAELEALLRARPASAVNKTWLDRMRDEFNFNQESLKR